MALTDDEIAESISRLQAGMRKLEAGTTFADRGVTYVNTDELLARIEYFQSIQRSRAGRPRQMKMVTGKGL